MHVMFKKWVLPFDKQIQDKKPFNVNNPQKRGRKLFALRLCLKVIRINLVKCYNIVVEAKRALFFVKSDGYKPLFSTSVSAMAGK